MIDRRMLWGAALLATAAAAAPPEQRLSLPGLKAPAEILVDRWGVAHIYAQNQPDAFFLQGWNAARDRLWQIDLWRRGGLGELAAVLGESYAAKDAATRLFVYRGDLKREWAAYGATARGEITAFAAGVNAYVAATRRDPALLPPEFKLAGFLPAFWRPEDVVRVRNGTLVFSASMAPARAAATCKDGKTPLLPKISPAWTPRVPQGLDLCSIPEKVLDQYWLATAAVTFTADGRPKLASAADRPDGARFLGEGSNNWVIGPGRTTTGRPILANDPHRGLDVPSLRYLVHVSAPGLNVIGAGEPGLPGISLGHNDDVALGLTVFFIAQEDLYVYETQPGHPDRYRYRGRWEKMRTVNERLAVRGAADRAIALRFTRHGPVLFADPARNRAYALKATWLGAGGAPYLGSLRVLRAKNVEQVHQALNHWGEPGSNLVVADRTGNIGWYPSGFVPGRTNSDGLLPLPGDGRYEWQGLRPRDQLPSQVNPSRGYIATANQMNLPGDYPIAERPVSFFWFDRARIDRIEEVLGAPGKTSVADSARLQNDYVTTVGRRLTRLLAGLRPADPALADMARWLAGWDAQLTADSAQAGLYEIWLSRHLLPAAIETLAPSLPPIGRRMTTAFNTGDVIGFLEHPGESFGARPEQGRDALLERTLAAAIDEIGRRLGPDRARWAWGRLGHAEFRHRLAPLADEATRKAMTVGPLAKSGDAQTVGVAGYDGDFRAIGGASVRLVMDVGDWDKSLAINTPGQGGSWTSPHYADLFRTWRDGGYFPLVYSREAVEKATERRIVLQPGMAMSRREQR